jgi:hypothetical protein
MLRFSYLEEPLIGSAPPSLATGTTSRWRPLVPVRIIGPTGRSRLFLRSLLDPGSDDTIFPLDVAALIGTQLRTRTKHSVRWRGQRHRLEFGDVELELADAAETLRWPAVVGFSDAPIRYPLLGIAGCLQFLDVTFLGDQRAVLVQTNTSYPGTTS